MCVAGEWGVRKMRNLSSVQILNEDPWLKNWKYSGLNASWLA
jgi:hypothetical protein